MTIFLLIVGLLAASMLLLAQEFHIRVLGLRVTRIVTGAGRANSRFDRLMTWMSGVGARYRKFYSTESIEQLRTIAQSSGFNPHRVVPVILGGKILSMFLFPAIAVVMLQFATSLNERISILLVGVALGVMVPRGVLSFIRRRYNAAIRRGTPEAIDLLVVCSEAGMGLESALERVAQEMRRSNTSMAGLLDGLLDDLRVLPRQEAFAKLATRSDHEGLRRLGMMISQSMQHGTPLGHVLRTVADELRRDRLVRLEERAHKLGAKLLVPMVLFLLPAMGIVLGASSFLRLMDAFKHLG